LLGAGASRRDELVLEAAAAEVVQVLEGHRRVAQDLYGLDAGDLVEEPAAGGVHEHAVALQLEQPARLDARVSSSASRA